MYNESPVDLNEICIECGCEIKGTAYKVHDNDERIIYRCGRCQGAIDREENPDVFR